MQPWVTGLWLGLAERFEEHSRTSVTDTEQSKWINLLEVKQIGIGVNKMDCDTAGSKQYKCDEIFEQAMKSHVNPQELSVKRTPTTCPLEMVRMERTR